MEHPLVNDLMAQFGGFPNPVDRMIPTILIKYPTFIKIDKKFNLSREGYRAHTLQEALFKGMSMNSLHIINKCAYL